MIFFTSDNHFWHRKVIEYCNRPYNTVEEMNEAMVIKWNSVVGPDDYIYFLGDFSLAFRAVETFSTRLNGNKILIPGNHDFCHSYHKKSRDPENRARWVQKYADYGWQVIDEQTERFFIDLGFVKMCHHPYSDGPGDQDKYAKWRPYDNGMILLCGHIHEKWKTKRSPIGTLQINVGCDVWDMKPVSLDEIIALVGQENGKK